ncbi:MAG: UDP-N-acetylmuramate dehydrogenase [Burkholderiaceae bacterium]|jgi:UDP-N-acetylmuramate dehydrogenase
MPDLLKTQVELVTRHTFGLAAKAARWLDISDESALQKLVRERVIGVRATAEQLILGEGSNTVFLADYPGLIVHPRLRGIRLLGQTDEHVLIEAAAGENWHALVEWTLAHGLPGLENLALIPGSVGACPVQNIGAYGLEVAERIHSVRYVDLQTGEVCDLPAAECGFGYRHSRFKDDLAQRACITAVRFCLPIVWRARIAYRDISDWLARAALTQPVARNVFDAVVAVRTAKLPDPTVLGNCGSFFKNPVVDAATAAVLLRRFPGLVHYSQPDGRVKLAAGWLIDHSCPKGQTCGAAAVWRRQALVLVNLGGATAGDLKRLVGAVQRRMRDVFGIDLEPEPVLVG